MMTPRPRQPHIDNYRSSCVEAICETSLLAAPKATLIEVLPPAVVYEDYARVVQILSARENPMLLEARLRSLFYGTPAPSRVMRLPLFTPRSRG